MDGGALLRVAAGAMLSGGVPPLPVDGPGVAAEQQPSASGAEEQEEDDDEWDEPCFEAATATSTTPTQAADDEHRRLASSSFAKSIRSFRAAGTLTAPAAGGASASRAGAQGQSSPR